MNNAERIANLKPEQYQELFVAKKETFDKMLEILEADYQKKHQRGGRPPKLSVLDKLIIMLQYYKEYRVMECEIERPEKKQRQYYSGKKTTYDENPNHRG